jgi:hypothetical protein
MDNHKCNLCNKLYSSYKSLWNHTKIFHKTRDNIDVVCQPNVNCLKKPKIICEICNKEFNTRQSKSKHKKKCKEINNNKIEQLEGKNKIKQLEATIKELKEQPSINNQLINLIVDKTNTIEELKTKIDENKTDNNSLIEINNNLQLIHTLKLNNIDVISRNEDNYVNAIQLCQAGGKQFNDWYLLESTKKLLDNASIDIEIPISQLIDIKQENNNEVEQVIWIHPDLAIQLAQWISPQFALQVTKCIRTLFISTIQQLEEKNKEIKIKDNKIKLLEDLCIKKQKRKEYPEKNVIYILTTEDNKKKRLYIIGKATKLKNRLSNYNKTAEHEVVYYKSCKSEEDMNIIEQMVINKLKDYKEKANRDRFILPIEKDITFFTDIIDKSIQFY